MWKLWRIYSVWWAKKTKTLQPASRVIETDKCDMHTQLIGLVSNRMISFKYTCKNTKARRQTLTYSVIAPELLGVCKLSAIARPQRFPNYSPFDQHQEDYTQK